jgi:hypothetical protein
LLIEKAHLVLAMQQHLRGCNTLGSVANLMLPKQLKNGNKYLLSESLQQVTYCIDTFLIGIVWFGVLFKYRCKNQIETIL